MQQQSFNLLADYYQFYLWDEGIGPDAPTEWSDEDIARRLKSASNILVVCPVRNWTVSVTVQVHETEPAYDAKDWDHIAETSLDLQLADFKFTNVRVVPSDDSQFYRVLTGSELFMEH